MADKICFSGNDVNQDGSQRGLKYISFGALFALNMLVGTDAGDTYTESEVREWMETAGFVNIQRKDTGFGTTLMIGNKGQQ